MKVVSIINYKGGVGKTTVTSNLAAYVASKGKRVLMIDVDPQTNLTLSFIDSIKWAEKYASNKTLKNFFEPILGTSKGSVSLKDLIIPLNVEGVKLDLISSHLDLLNIDIKLAANLTAQSLQALVTNYLKVHNYMRKEVEQLKEIYDLVLIDCPPSFSIVTKNVLVASDHYLTPSKMDFLSAFGAHELTRNIGEFIEEYNQYVQFINISAVNPSPMGIVATMVKIMSGDLIAANKSYWDQLKRAGHEIFDSFIPENGSFAAAPSKGIPVVLDPNAYTGAVKELQKLGDEFMKKAGI